MSGGIRCTICPHGCVLSDGQVGLCRARANRDGSIVALNYGVVTAMALDPIEKKPLRRFHPGSTILSVGSFGCNMRCPYCQNYEISMTDAPRAGAQHISPEELVEQALALVPRGNIGVAYTYNEPLIGYEYVRDGAALLKAENLSIVLVTNGFVNETPLTALLPDVDAMNIDLKSFDAAVYKSLKGGIDTVKRTIELSAAQCHVEVTTLIVPGMNDTGDEMQRLSKWLASVDPNIPLHISRFFPRYHVQDKPPTPVADIFALADIARGHLKHVYAGNC